jgi:hypothetical protein
VAGVAGSLDRGRRHGERRFSGRAAAAAAAAATATPRRHGN